MNLSAPFIKRPVMTILVMVGFIFFGIIAFKNLPVSDIPSIEYPTLVVSGGLPGGSPEFIANSLTAPLERAFLNVEGVEFMSSSSTYGSSTIILQFNLDTDINAAAADVNAQITATLSQLPQQMPASPTYKKVNPAASPILYISVGSYVTPREELQVWAQNYLSERISLIKGVATVQVYGSPYSPRVKVDPQLISTKGLDLSDIARVIQVSNVNIPVGGMDGISRYYLFNVDGQIMNADGYKSLVYNTNNGAYGIINNISNTVNSTQNDKEVNYLLKKGAPPKQNVVLAIRNIPGSNTLEVCQAIKKALPELKLQIPKNIDIEILFDRSIFIEDAIDDINFTLIFSIFLVIIIVFIYIGSIRDAIIPSIVIPVSIITTFGVMYLLDFSIDILSLLGLVLANGFVVDDAIVVMENITRYIGFGKKPFEAALEGSKQISITVFTMTLSLIAAFIPVIFLQGLLGRSFYEFAMTMTIAVIVSGVVSLTLTPMLAAYIPSKAGAKNKLNDFAEGLNKRMIGVYQPLLKKVFNWPKTTLFVLMGMLLITGIILDLIPKTLDLKDDLGLIIAATQTSQTFSSDKTTAYQLNLLPLFLSDSGVEALTSITGLTNSSGIIVVGLKDISKRAPIGDIIHRLQTKLRAQPGINTYLRALPLLNLDSGAGGSGDYQYAFTSLDPEVLYEGAEKMTQALKATPGFVGVNNDMLRNVPQVSMHLLRERASLLNISTQAIENALQYGYAMAQVSLVNGPTDQFYVTLETEESFQNDPSSLNQIMVKSADNKLSYLKDLVEITTGAAAASVNHINQLASVTFSFSLSPTIALSEALKIIADLHKKVMDPRVEGRIIGAGEELQRTLKSILILTFISVVIIYILLGILYESFLFPITVLSVLPVAAFGGLLTLYLFGEPLSVYAMIGLVMLIGIVKKNGIILVDFAVEYMQEKKISATEAMQEACITRFRPIMMTTLAAIAGAAPIALAIGGNSAISRRPLGLVIIGGLIFSQLITLLITPIVFVKIEQLRHFFKKKDQM